MAERPESDEGGGWRFDFIGEVHNDLMCAICYLPMKDPQQISACGHCMCQSCLDKVLGSTNQCPQDRKPISKSNVFKDTRMERSIMGLRVKCQNSGRGCEWIGELADLLKRHLETCKKAPISCTRKKCTEKPLREVFEWHLLHECEWRMINCEYCDGKIIACELEPHHKRDCLEHPASCDNNCGMITARKQMGSHLEQCPNRIVSCQYSEVGCNEKIEAKDLNMHIESCVRTHMNQLFVAFLNQRANMEKLSKENKELRKTNFELSEAVKELKQNQDMLLGSIKGDVIQRLKVENFDFHSEYVEFLWEIENFREKSKETLNLVSPAISSGSKGYLFCFQMQSRRSKFNFAGIRFVDVSVDAMILQGPYDDILPWPCKLVCEITLIKKDKISNDTNVVNDWRGEDFNPVRKKNIFTLRTIQPEEVVINNSIFVKFKLQRYSAE